MIVADDRVRIIKTGEIGYVVDYLKDGKIQLDVVENITIDKITFKPTIKRKTVFCTINDIETL